MGRPTDEGEPQYRVSRFWRDSRTAGASVGPVFGALDEVFNPAAARAQELLQAEHERQVPVPSPGDDALRTGTMRIRIPPHTPAEDIHSPD